MKLFFIPTSIVLVAFFFFGVPSLYAEEGVDPTSPTANQERPLPYQEIPPAPVPPPPPERPLPPEGVPAGERREAVVKETREAAQEQRMNAREERQEHRQGVYESVMEKREETRANIEENRDARQERREETRSRVEANMIERVTALKDRTVRILNAGENRLQGIIDRIESRMAKLEESGVDTGSARALLEEAKSALARAGALIREIATLPAPEEGTIRETVQKIRETTRSAHDEMRNATEAIRNAVQALKEGSVTE